MQRSNNDNKRRMPCYKIEMNGFLHLLLFIIVRAGTLAVPTTRRHLAIFLTIFFTGLLTGVWPVLIQDIRGNSSSRKRAIRGEIKGIHGRWQAGSLRIQ